MHVRFLVIGAGMTGLAFANFIPSDDVLILEADSEIGGWCKTIHQDGFVWDYSGHFFHFRNPDIEAYLVDRMPPNEVVTVTKNSRISYKGHDVDFPFQKNIHQLPKDEFLECLHDLVFRPNKDPANFQDMLVQKFGKGIADKFLIPYNTKLYACDLNTLDADAMGRFFPYADLTDIVRNMRESDNATYNAAFTYPRNGAFMYVKALADGLRPDTIRLNTRLETIDLRNRRATTSKGEEITFEFLISSMPFNRMLDACKPSLGVETQSLTSNKVLVFNLGFDRKGPPKVHWIYYPDESIRFYRVGFYDNIIDSERMSLYVEIGLASGAEVDVNIELQRVISDLKRVGVVDEHQLVSSHSVTMDPAYVHITKASRKTVEETRRQLSARGVFTIGRYGGWTYCSIEDNILEARELAQLLTPFV